MKGLTDVPGILVGHVSDYEGLTGCTVILCEGGAVGGADLRGSATGTEEFELFNPLHVTERIHGVVLAGGSAFGLEAASGVRRFLEHKGVGFHLTGPPVPLVPCAILYDLGIGKSNAHPTREMGESAAAAATSKAVVEGAVGAGTGATVGKLFGMERAMKSGLGTYSVLLSDGVVVSALAAVNAVGDVIDPSTAKIVAGARAARDSREFANTAEQLKRGVSHQDMQNKNTTLVVVATNARLTKPMANKLAQFGSAGVARAISPVWTMYDGDLVIALSTGDKQADVNTLGVAAAEAVTRSIIRAVELAPTLGGVPGLKG
jgi:L-aminopeptidase/D-esterase-like protein